MKSGDQSKDMNKWKQNSILKGLWVSLLYAYALFFTFYLQINFSTILAQAVEIMADGNS